jgi:MoaA/NifB/PqqE/SkfB family radical SAM enzyme
MRVGSEIFVHAGPGLVKVKPIRHAITRRVEASMLKGLEEGRKTSPYPPGVDDDRTAIGLALVRSVERALVSNHYSTAALHCLFNTFIQKLVIEQGDTAIKEQFRTQYGVPPPTFLAISPSKACNLQCAGCYADSGPAPAKLDWDVCDHMITEAEKLWGAHFFAISGGEPLAYRSNGEGVLDLAERHPDSLFIMYTNGTLIDHKLAIRLARLGNLYPAISLEGWEKRTDARRGAGVYRKVMAAMYRLREAGAPFGVSLTATRENAEELLSEDFIDFCFTRQGALFGFTFQYMPIGRSYTLDLMPTPQQRMWMWRRSWEIIRQRGIFMVDFWNQATLTQGCISAGRDNGGGDLFVDWNGAISPCVFMPYSPVNIKDIYAQGKTLNDAWNAPFFAGLRDWQRSYRNESGNWLAPCPIRDHHADLRRLLAAYEPDPTDANARAALLDENYAKGLAEYDASYQALSGTLWQKHYLRPGAPSDGGIPPLPEISEFGVQ